MSKLIGTNPGQVPTNADLGELAYMNKESVIGTAFRITASSSVTYNDGTWTDVGPAFDTVEYDINGDWNTSTSRFDVKVAGVYIFNLAIHAGDNSLNRLIYSVSINGDYGANRLLDIDQDGAGNLTDSQVYSLSSMYFLQPGDYVEPYVFADTDGTWSFANSQSHFSCCLLRGL